MAVAEGNLQTEPGLQAGWYFLLAGRHRGNLARDCLEGTIAASGLVLSRAELHVCNYVRRLGMGYRVDDTQIDRLAGYDRIRLLDSAIDHAAAFGPNPPTRHWRATRKTRC